MRIFLLFLAGLLGGVFGGMGMGGGTLLILLLLFMCGLDQLTAQSINLLAFIPMAAVALGIHARKKLVDWKSVWPIIIPAALTGAGGALLAQIVKPGILTKLFGAFIILLGIYQLFTLARGKAH